MKQSVIIDGERFDLVNLSVQFSMPGPIGLKYCEIEIEIIIDTDIKYRHILNLINNTINVNILPKNNKFNIETSTFLAVNCSISSHSLDFSTKIVTMNLFCDYIEYLTETLAERRDKIIDSILENKTEI